MTASRKQEIYQEILFWVLPFARNTQTWPFWRRARVNLYEELELVHNLAPLLLYAEFRRQDIYWINTQANNYVVQCKLNPAGHQPYGPVMKLLEELVSLLPTELEDILRAPAIPRHTAPFSSLENRH